MNEAACMLSSSLTCSSRGLSGHCRACWRRARDQGPVALICRMHTRRSGCWTAAVPVMAEPVAQPCLSTRTTEKGWGLKRAKAGAVRYRVWPPSTSAFCKKGEHRHSKCLLVPVSSLYDFTYTRKQKLGMSMFCHLLGHLCVIFPCNTVHTAIAMDLLHSCCCGLKGRGEVLMNVDVV